MKLSRFLTATALAGVAIAIPQAAFAQDVPAADEETGASTSGEVVVVTGSRIARPGIDTPVPVTSVSVADLTDSGNLSLGDALNELPSLRSTFSQANSTRAIGTAGLNLLDLRGLGTARTLVLVNGRRHVTSTPGSYAVDVNTIPSALLERVDVVTGGNSATYGSDAVSGVVNFVLKDDYEGLEVTGQGGISSRGDRDSQRLSAVWGSNFADGRGNIAIAAEYARSETLLFTDRDEQTGAYSGIPGYFTSEPTAGEPAEGDGIPDQTFFGVNSPGNRFGIISIGGTVLTTCTAANGTLINAAQRQANCTGELSPTGGRLSDNYVFLPDGSLVRDDPTLDLRSIGGARFGGLTATGVEGAMLLPGLERFAGNVLLKYEFSPAATAFLEAKFVKITNNQTSTQPTFINSNLSPVFYLDNPFLSAQARDAIRTIQAYAPGTANYDTGAFTFFRFNNDIGTRAEDHERETFRIVGGLRGNLSDTGNLRYEIAGNFGRTDTYYETGGNVNIANFNKAANAALNGSGQIVCRVNAVTVTDPNCRPLNLFGEYAPLTTPDALAYVLHTSSRKQWAEQLNFVGYVSGDTSGMFELPGGPVAMVLGAEYRREDAYSDYDDITQSGATFLNGFATFDPPAIEVKEAFAELRIPLLGNMPFFHELSFEGSARVSDYSTASKEVWAYNVGAVWAPIRDLRFRVGYAKSVRAPDLSDVYATPGQTFANNLTDPCDQPGTGNNNNNITSNPNRAANCAAAGIPTTITLPDGSTVPWHNRPSSGISGVTGGNPNLLPEIGKSFTVGAVFQPSFLRGFSLTVDYYNIEIEQAINSLTGQAIINRCYDDPTGLNNPFCDAVFRRSSSDGLVDGTFAGQAGRRFDGFPDFNLTGAPYNQTIAPGFLQAPFNYAKLKTSGIDVDASYTTRIGEGTVTARTIVSWLDEREQFTYITQPDRSDRINNTLGDPEWQGQFSVNLNFPTWDFGYDLRYVGKQTVYAWETQFGHQGRSPTNADIIADPFYPALWYHDAQVGVKVADGKYRFYIGVDNITDELPPLGATGTSANSAIWSVTGRYFYAGFRVRM